MNLFDSNVLPLPGNASPRNGTCLQSIKTIFTAIFLALLFCISPGFLFAQNPIAVENAKTGNPASEWDIPNGGETAIMGFATQMSVNKGQTIKFKIKTDALGYKINVYRLGYYNGLGARKIGVGQVTAALPQIQPTDNYDFATGMTDCSNWSESASFSVPSDAVSGLYIAKLIRNDNGASNHIVFIVRDDASKSDLLFKTSDATWQAYNNYGGNSFYQGSLYGNVTPIPVLGFAHATKISYDRPFNNRNGSRDWFTIAEMPMIRFLEKNGYDLSYTTCVDMAKSVGNITPTQHKVLMSVGHDEYWSAEERDKFENARNAGVHLAFFSGNEVYWKTRWENNHRTLVCYKEGKQGELQCYDKCDPLTNVWTGLWRSGCDWPSADGCNPENALSGQISWSEAADPIEVPSAYKDLRFWRNTSIASLAPGQTATLAESTIGFEYDFEQLPETYPNGRITMSETKLGLKTHKLSLYKHSSGAWVFGAGTVQWSWGLDTYHGLGNDDPDKNYTADVRMQQATVNLFADMNVQPATLQSDLIRSYPSTDVTPPVTSITTPDNIFFGKRKAAIITGTASDIGGEVAGVELSFDGGETWQVAEGTKDWTYSWYPETEGVIVVKVRAFDDSGNMEATPGTSNTITVNVGPEACPCTVFEPFDTPDATQNDDTGIETGLKFQSSRNGFITGIRFYKGNDLVDTYIGNLWTPAGTLLARVNFNVTPTTGWQQAMFATPVPITAGTTYIVSVFSKSGDYVFSRPYFDQTTVENGPLTALADGEDGPNGVYVYSNTSTFPIDTYQSTNYWVDAIFDDIKVNLPPVVTTNPASKTICVDNQVSFTSAATGEPAPAVQWQESVNGTTWTNIAGATSATLTFTATTANNGKKYRAVWTNAGGVVYSTVATLTISKITASVISKTNAGCTNGSITISQSGGTAPYTYKINNGQSQSSNVFNNLIQGVYNITVTDSKGCSTVVPNIVITQSSSTLNALILSKSDVSCNNDDGALYLLAYFGAWPYQYSLDGVEFQSSALFTGIAPGTYNAVVKDAKGCTTTIPNIRFEKSSNLSATVSSKTNESCAGKDGSITISASGGYGYYSYSLNGGNYQSSNTFRYLAEGVYKVTVRDQKGCTFVVNNIAINQASSVKATLASKSDAVCGLDNGSITIVGSNGTAPYTYILSNGRYQSSGTFSNLDAGTYTVWVLDSKKCLASVSGITITETSTLNLTATSIKNADCSGSGGSITVAATGGKPGYQYSLDGGRFQSGTTFSNVSSGKHKITVKDSKGCTKTITGVEVSTTPFKVFASKITGESCIGRDGTIKIAATGGSAPYNYKINGGKYFRDNDNVLTNLSAGTYSVTVKDDEGCTATISGLVIPKTKLSTSVDQTNACRNINNGSITVNAKGGTAPYQYSLNGGYFRSSNKFTGLSPATYWVAVKDAKGCITYESGIYISRTSTTCSYRGTNSNDETDVKSKNGKSLVEVSGAPSLSVFPNPSNGNFNVVLKGFEQETVIIKVVDVLGRTVATKKVSLNPGINNVPFSLGNVTKGMYHLTVSSDVRNLNEKVLIQ